MGNTVSDLCYSDNPKRRKRAEGLRQDIRQFVQDFEREKVKKLRHPRPLLLHITFFVLFGFKC